MQMKKWGKDPRRGSKLPKHVVRWPGVLVLAQHLAVAEIFILVYHHSVGLGGDVENDIGLVAVFVHGALVVGEGSLAILVGVVGVEELAETLDAYAAEDTEDVALMFVELCLMLATILGKSE